MLHILLLILKIIGIILAVILGILLLLVGIILFVPIRYEISAKCDGTIESLKVKGKATWLLHLVRADVFLKGKKLKWKVRFAWLKRSNVPESTTRKDEKNNEVEEIEYSKNEETTLDTTVCEQTPEICEEKCENPSQEFTEHRVEGSSETTEKNNETEVDESKSKKEKRISFFKKIKMKVQNISDKIKNLLEKKNKITEFLTTESHVNAFKKIKEGLIVLLKRLSPKKVKFKLRFGFEDPSLTGQVLGGLSIVYPFLGDSTEIIPDFGNQILEGNVYLKGKIRFCHFVVLALKLLVCKDVRTSYKDIRNFKL